MYVWLLGDSSGDLGPSLGDLGGLLGSSWGALGPSCVSTSMHDIFMKGHDRFCICFVAKTMAFVRDRDFDAKNIMCF